MKHTVARIHSADNVLVALADLPIGTEVPWNGGFITVTEPIPANTLTPEGLAPGQDVTMYGVLVGQAREAIRPGGRLTTANIRHATDFYDEAGSRPRPEWQAPDVSRWQDRTFLGFHRPDGRVGTANYWLLSRWFSAKTATFRCWKKPWCTTWATPAAKPTSPRRASCCS